MLASIVPSSTRRAIRLSTVAERACARASTTSGESAKTIRCSRTGGQSRWQHRPGAQAGVGQAGAARHRRQPAGSRLDCAEWGRLGYAPLQHCLGDRVATLGQRLDRFDLEPFGEALLRLLRFHQHLREASWRGRRVSRKPGAIQELEMGTTGAKALAAYNAPPRV